MLTRYLNRALPTVMFFFAFLWGSALPATQTPPFADDVYISTIPTLPLHENPAFSALPVNASDSPAQRDSDLDPDANNAAPFQWKNALRQGLFFTGFMHAYRLASESQTRDALNGHWWRNYRRSIGELRGWDDGDKFMTTYVAHPFEGAIFGYIAQQNDPRYSRVMWGDGRKYWIARLRTLAFSTAMSTQWTLGPASEASTISSAVITISFGKSSTGRPALAQKGVAVAPGNTACTVTPVPSTSFLSACVKLTT